MDTQINGKLQAIGSEYTDQTTGEKFVPLYHKDPSTGVLKTSLVNVGSDQTIVANNQALDTEISTILEDIKGNDNSPEAIDYYKGELQKQYGDTAVAKLDEALA